MHDPMVVMFEIRRPWPRVRLMKRAYGPTSGEYYDALSRWGQLKFHARSPFWRFGRVELYWPGLLTFWHNEPGGRDYSEVCGRLPPRGRRRYGFAWRHREHVSVQVLPWRSLRRWLFDKCALCGKPSSRTHPVNVSHSWDGPRGKGVKSTPGIFHSDCSSIISLRRTISTDREALAEMFHLARTLLDLSEEEMIAKLYSHPHGPDWTNANHRRGQIETALGWKFDHDHHQAHILSDDEGGYWLINDDGRRFQPHDLARAQGWMK